MSRKLGTHCNAYHQLGGRHSGTGGASNLGITIGLLPIGGYSPPNIASSRIVFIHSPHPSLGRGGGQFDCPRDVPGIWGISYDPHGRGAAEGAEIVVPPGDGFGKDTIEGSTVVLPPVCLVGRGAIEVFGIVLSSLKASGKVDFWACMPGNWPGLGALIDKAALGSADIGTCPGWSGFGEGDRKTSGGSKRNSAATYISGPISATMTIATKTAYATSI